jgi:hypothetical protein
MEADRRVAEAWGSQPGGVDRAVAPRRRLPRRAWLLVGVLAAIAVVWFLGDNTPSFIAGAVTAAVALGLALRLLQLRR